MPEQQCTKAAENEAYIDSMFACSNCVILNENVRICTFAPDDFLVQRFLQIGQDTYSIRYKKETRRHSPVLQL